MELEVINKLFLELSQIATAQTKEELRLKTVLKKIVELPQDQDGTTEMKMRLIAKEALR